MRIAFALPMLTLSGPDRLEAGGQGWLCLNGGRFWLRHGRSSSTSSATTATWYGRNSRVDHLDPFGTIHVNLLSQFGISGYLMIFDDVCAWHLISFVA